MINCSLHRSQFSNSRAMLVLFRRPSLINHCYCLVPRGCLHRLGMRLNGRLQVGLRTGSSGLGPVAADCGRSSSEKSSSRTSTRRSTPLMMSATPGWVKRNDSACTALTLELVHALHELSYRWLPRHIHLPQMIDQSFFSHLQIFCKDLVS